MLSILRRLSAVPHKVSRWLALSTEGHVLIGASIVLGVIACTPQDRVTAKTAIDSAAPVLCPFLAALTGADGATVGLVCSDVSKALSGALAVARVDGRPTMARVAGVSNGCTPIMLADVDPSRDPREYVCAEALTSAEVRKALGVGHAK